jgi:transcriptional regulator with XRE-family HTH domain
MHCKKSELQRIREHLKYTFQDMADELKLNRATYQGYETGRRAAPVNIVSAARQAQKRVDAFMSGISLRVDENI